MVHTPFWQQKLGDGGLLVQGVDLVLFEHGAKLLHVGGGKEGQSQLNTDAPRLHVAKEDGIKHGQHPDMVGKKSACTEFSPRYSEGIVPDNCGDAIAKYTNSDNCPYWVGNVPCH